MSDFDPYRKWLGIPETARPISKYRLLGIDDFEDDRDVISTAAERQTVYLRTLQAGEHEVLVAELLNEVSQARVTLLNADQKAEYDEGLREQQSPEPEAEPTPIPIPVVQTPAPIPVVVRGTVTQEFPVSVVQPAKKPRRRKPKKNWKQPAVIGISVVGVIGVLVLFISLISSEDTEPVASNVPPVVSSPLISSPEPAPVQTSAKSLPASLQEGLIAYYPFNGNAQDESGNGHHGTVEGAAIGIDRFDSLDKSYGFNSLGRIRIPDDHLLDIKDNDSLTISVWVFFVPGSNRQFIVSKQNTVPIDGRSPCYFLHLNHLKEGNLQLVVQDRGQRQVTITSSISKLPYGKWHHLVAVIDKSRASGGLFLDGVAMTSGTKQKKFSSYLQNKPTDEFVQSLENDGDLFLGSRRDTNHFNGQLDDVRIYNRALSEAEVQQLYDFEKP